MNIVLFHILRFVLGLFIGAITFYIYDMQTAILSACIIPCALYCLQAKPKNYDPFATGYSIKAAKCNNHKFVECSICEWRNMFQNKYVGKNIS